MATHIGAGLLVTTLWIAIGEAIAGSSLNGFTTYFWGVLIPSAVIFTLFAYSLTASLSPPAFMASHRTVIRVSGVIILALGLVASMIVLGHALRGFGVRGGG